jgi:hypothetical protein
MFCSKTFIDPVVRRAALLSFALFLTALAAKAHTLPPPIQLSFGAAGGSSPVMALDSKGNIDVAWIGSSIFFARSTDGGVTFSIPKEVQPLPSSASNLQIGLDARDHINLIWTAPDGAFLSRSTDLGFAFSVPTNLSSNPGVMPDSLQMVVEPGGSINLVWVRVHRPVPSEDAFFSRSTDGGETFSVPVAAARTPHGRLFFSSDVQAVLGPKGQIYIFMTQNEEHGNSDSCDVVFVRSIDRGSTFSSPLDISGSAGLCSAAKPVVDSRGNINVALSYRSPGPGSPGPPENVVFRRSTDEGASFSTPVNVSGVPHLFFTSDLRMVVDASEDIYIVWNTSALFFARSHDRGATFFKPKILSVPPAPNFFRSHSPALAVDSCGNISVAWSDSGLGDSSGDADIFFKRSTDEGVTLPNPVDLSHTPGQSAVTPQMAVNARGDAYLVWQANVSNVASQVFFGRVPESFSQPVDFSVRVSPKSADAAQGETLQFKVAGHDLDDAKELDLICSPLPSSALLPSDDPVFATCTFNPPSLSAHHSHSTAHLTVTIPPTFLTGSYFLGVNAVGGSTVNTQTVELNVTAPGDPAPSSTSAATDSASLRSALAGTLGLNGRRCREPHDDTKER